MTTSYDIETGSFAEACYDCNSIESLNEALKNGPDEADMRVWGLTDAEWTEQVQLAIGALKSEA